MDVTMYQVLKVVEEKANINVSIINPIELKVADERKLNKDSSLVDEIMEGLIDVTKQSVGIDTTKCVPHPVKPNFDKYMEIGFYSLVLIILCLADYIVIRFRSNLLEQFYPQRILPRA